MPREEPTARARSTFRTTTARLGHAAFRRLGFDVVRVRHLDDFATRRQLALSDVDVVIDVGANVGQYGRLLRRAGFSGRIVSFEPLPAAYERLRRHAASDDMWTCLPFALADYEGQATLNVTRNRVSSSLLEITRTESDEAPETSVVDRVDVAVRTLDSMSYKLLSAVDRLFLKLDVQGAEDRVLAGARETSIRIRAIECELSILPLYEGQPPISDLAQLLLHRGFRLAAIEPEYHDLRSGQLKQLNGLFLADP